MTKKEPRESRRGHRGPRYAPGDGEPMNRPATPEERRAGNFTRVTRLSWDEVEPSKE